ncbi:MAG: hypothetical protein WKF65_10565 [Gaiellaceae bacterium]
MEADIAEHAPDESGGMLIDYWSENGDAVITNIIAGGPSATRRPNSFVPDGRWQERLAEIYNRSGLSTHTSVTGTPTPPERYARAAATAPPHGRSPEPARRAPHSR